MSDLDRKVAETKGLEYRTLGTGIYIQNAEGSWISYSPRTNIVQAMELLEEFEWYKMDKFGQKDYRCAIRFGQLSFYSFPQQSMTEAICVAYLKRKGNEDWNE